jgi:hypothetical protein
MNGKWAAIVVVIVVVAAAAAGYAGYTMGKNAGVAQGITARNAFLAARGVGGTGGNGGGGGGFGGGAGGAGGRNFDPNNFAAGQVKSISGDTVQLSTATDVVTVKLTDQTQIQKQASGTVSDIQPGERLTVQGTRNSDGSFTAQTVQVGRQGFGGGNGNNGSGNGSSGSGNGTTTPGNTSNSGG